LRAAGSRETPYVEVFQGDAVGAPVASLQTIRGRTVLAVSSGESLDPPSTRLFDVERRSWVPPEPGADPLQRPLLPAPLGDSGKLGLIEVPPEMAPPQPSARDGVLPEASMHASFPSAFGILPRAAVLGSSIAIQAEGMGGLWRLEAPLGGWASLAGGGVGGGLVRKGADSPRGGAPQPGACAGASFAAVGTSAILFGGVDWTASGAKYCGAWRIHAEELSAHGVPWEPLDTFLGSGERGHPEVAGHAAVFDSRGGLLVFGGLSRIAGKGSLQGRCQLTAAAWTLRFGDHPPRWQRAAEPRGKIGPPPRAHHACALMTGPTAALVCHGGIGCSGELLGDTWVLDIGTGVWREVLGEVSPGRRAGVAMAALSGSKVILHGGISDEPVVVKGDTWMLQPAHGPEAMEWVQLAPAEPVARAFHHAVHLGSGLVAFVAGNALDKKLSGVLGIPRRFWSALGSGGDGMGEGPRGTFDVLDLSELLWRAFLPSLRGLSRSLAQQGTDAEAVSVQSNDITFNISLSEPEVEAAGCALLETAMKEAISSSRVTVLGDSRVLFECSLGSNSSCMSGNRWVTTPPINVNGSASITVDASVSDVNGTVTVGRSEVNATGWPDEDAYSDGVMAVHVAIWPPANLTRQLMLMGRPADQVPLTLIDSSDGEHEAAIINRTCLLNETGPEGWLELLLWPPHLEPGWLRIMAEVSPGFRCNLSFQDLSPIAAGDDPLSFEFAIKVQLNEKLSGEDPRQMIWPQIYVYVRKGQWSSPTEFFLPENEVRRQEIEFAAAGFPFVYKDPELPAWSSLGFAPEDVDSLRVDVVANSTSGAFVVASSSPPQKSCSNPPKLQLLLSVDFGLKVLRLRLRYEHCIGADECLYPVSGATVHLTEVWSDATSCARFDNGRREWRHETTSDSKGEAEIAVFTESQCLSRQSLDLEVLYGEVEIYHETLSMEQEQLMDVLVKHLLVCTDKNLTSETGSFPEMTTSAEEVLFPPSHSCTYWISPPGASFNRNFSLAIQSQDMADGDELVVKAIYDDSQASILDTCTFDGCQSHSGQTVSITATAVRVEVKFIASPQPRISKPAFSVHFIVQPVAAPSPLDRTTPVPSSFGDLGSQVLIEVMTAGVISTVLMLLFMCCIWKLCWIRLRRRRLSHVSEATGITAYMGMLGANDEQLSAGLGSSLVHQQLRHQRRRRGVPSSISATFPSYVYPAKDGSQAGDDEEQADCCSICLEDYTGGDILRILPCTHKFHDDCIMTWIQKHTSCPLCKQVLYEHRKTSAEPRGDTTNEPTSSTSVPDSTNLIAPGTVSEPEPYGIQTMPPTFSGPTPEQVHLPGSVAPTGGEPSSSRAGVSSNPVRPITRLIGNAG